MNLEINRQSKRNELSWFDILILTVIFWGHGITESTVSYIQLIKGTASIEENLVFSTSDNYTMLGLQAAFFTAAMLYLWFRHFDFGQWQIHFSLRAVAVGCAIFLVGALIMDLFLIITNPLQRIMPFPHIAGAFFGSKTVSTVIYAAFNGVYEELYFLGICTAVSPKHLKWAIPFSMLVRFSFHTYQGMLSAVGIGFLFGGLAYLLYRRTRDKNLLPFFVAHAIADIIGMGVLWYILR